jgi:hypothetical protein
MTGFAGVLDAKRPRRLRKLRNCIGRGAAGGNYCCCGACRSGAAEGSNYRRKELCRRNLSAQPAGRENREKRSLLDGDGAAEGDERGVELPAGRENREILSLLDVKARLAGGDDGVRGRIGREAAEETSEAPQQHWTRSGRGKLLLLRSLPKRSGGGKQLPEKRITSAKLVGTAGGE